MTCEFSDIIGHMLSMRYGYKSPQKLKADIPFYAAFFPIPDYCINTYQRSLEMSQHCVCEHQTYGDSYILHKPSSKLQTTLESRKTSTEMAFFCGTFFPD